MPRILNEEEKQTPEWSRYRTNLKKQPKPCACGTIGYIFKNNAWICKRCHTIELRMYGNAKTRSKCGIRLSHTLAYGDIV